MYGANHNMKTGVLYSGLARIIAIMTLLVVFADGAFAQVANPGGGGTANLGCDANLATANSTKCNVCVLDTGDFHQFDSSNDGQNMINSMFQMMNAILQNIEQTYYQAVIKNTQFQQILGVMFIMYVGIYGMMIMFNLATYTGGEVTSRLLKVVIVYGMCSPTGWTFFNNWIQIPVIGGINELITQMANAGSGGTVTSTNCITAGTFSGNSIMTSGTGGPTGNFTINLASGPMAMLWGPMSCVFGARFMAGIQALMLTGFYGWILGGILIYAMVEFVFMILGAIATYVKAIVGLTFLFALTPVFFAFYLFEKSRSITMAWISKVIAFALHPIILFAFLAFYAGIIGTAVQNIFTDSTGAQEDICYVPFFEMPNMLEAYSFRFKSQYANAAGGEWLNVKTGSSALGDPAPPPTQVLNVLYFLVLCALGKNFSVFIKEFADNLSGGTGAGVVQGEDIKKAIMQAVGGNSDGGGAASTAASQKNNSMLPGPLRRFVSGITGTGFTPPSTSSMATKRSTTPDD